MGAHFEFSPRNEYDIPFAYKDEVGTTSGNGLKLDKEKEGDVVVKLQKNGTVVMTTMKIDNGSSHHEAEPNI